MNHRPILALALDLARQGQALTHPNPSVGCVITDPSGQILGQGQTQKAGGPHAEVMALRDAAARGLSTQGATACVTLEPCSHQGRTGPCCDALIAAGIQTVVATLADPNPLVAGQGFARLRAAGVTVQVLPSDDPLAIASRELNIGFFSRMVRKTPWVRMKLAASLDGKTALDNGLSQWITSPEARADGHAWRARAGAILTGIGTVLADRPKLDVRLVKTARQPGLVVLDSQLRTPVDAALFQAERAVYIYAAVPDADKQATLQAAGARVIYLPGANGQVDLTAMLADLARREVNEVHVEAGEKLNGALIQAGLVDEFLLYLAPKLIGQGRGLAQFGPLTDLAQAMTLDFVATDRVGPDLRIRARAVGRDLF
jgi:diaminohydroxyphosphoribosylaminopyrimidine deaminase/5-amino-6-(5-phosphoribosylamino)uracil reductase